MSDAASRAGKSVLIVDDDEDVRDAMAEVVRASGRLPLTARDGSDALRILDSAVVPRPCLILLDWLMFPMNGDEFVAELQARAMIEDTIVIVMTGDTRVQPNTGMRNVLGTLMKPFNVDELLSVLDLFC